VIESIFGFAVATVAFAVDSSGDPRSGERSHVVVDDSGDPRSGERSRVVVDNSGDPRSGERSYVVVEKALVTRLRRDLQRDFLAFPLDHHFDFFADFEGFDRVGVIVDVFNLFTG